ncbi:MAG: c-type cytochrome biogenesis protein CcmI [Parvibaculum sp.]
MSLAFSGDIPLFVALALLAGIVVTLLLRPLRAIGGTPADRGESEVALYRDQLAEIVRDVDRGVIGEAEAEAARVEVSRRLLAADEMRQEAARRGEAADPRWRKGMAAVLALGVPLVALAIYLQEGSPGLPDRPIAARLAAPADTLPVEALVVRIERRLKAQPDDLQGWELIAPTYLRLGRYDDAAGAWTRAMILDGATAERLAARGEARVLAAEGRVTAGARADFEKAVALDAVEPRAQYFLGLADYDDGRRDAALGRWKALLAEAPEDAAWTAAVEARIAAVEAEAAGK